MKKKRKTKQFWDEIIAKTKILCWALISQLHYDILKFHKFANEPDLAIIKHFQIGFSI